jgi:hypothetical protein
MPKKFYKDIYEGRIDRLKINCGNETLKTSSNIPFEHEKIIS